MSGPAQADRGARPSQKPAQAISPDAAAEKALHQAAREECRTDSRVLEAERFGGFWTMGKALGDCVLEKTGKKLPPQK